MPQLVLVLLGPPRIELDGAPITIDTRKAIALIAYLAVTRLPQSRETLAALLWPDDDEPHARATLRRTLSVLSKALDHTHLIVARETLSLPPSTELHLDVDEFHRHLAACATHGHAATDVCAACLEPLSAATAVYRDDFMAGFSLRDSPAFDDWQTFQREGLRRELAGALERLTRLLISMGHYDSAIASARRWLALDRLHEPAHRYLMRLYAWSGQRAAALRQYQDCVRTLDQELGVAPLEATTRLYEAIKDHRAPPPPVRIHSTTSGSRRARPEGNEARSVAQVVRDGTTETSVTEVTGTSAGMLPPYRLVGRRAEWEMLLDAYAGIRSTGQVVALAGEAGIGKTRLAEEFTAYVRQHGGAVIATRCYDGEANLPYAPIAAALRAALAHDESARRLSDLPDRWLGEAARLVPEIDALRPGLSPVPPLERPGAQMSFYEGLMRVLVSACTSEQTPGVLFFDDIQWADSASLDMLTYLARRLREHPVCLLLTWRSSESPGGVRIRQLLAEAQRAGSAAVIPLSRLGEDAIRELVTTTPGVSSADEMTRRLQEETEGVPFFLIEYLRALSKGIVTADSQNWSVPGGVQELLRSRLNAVDETGAQVLAAAAVIGRWFDFERVRDVSGRSEEETISALEDLVARGLIRELPGNEEPAPAYDFSHDKLRSLVYDDLSLARRRLLHRRTAEALAAALKRRNGGAALGQIAHHYLLAGEQDTAAEYYKLAGERAKRLYAHAEALAHLGTALALGHPERAKLHAAIGEVHTTLGEYAAALKSYEAALEEARPEAAAEIEHQMGTVYARRGDWQEAQRHFAIALERSRAPEQRSVRASIYADWSLAAHRAGQLDRAWELAHEAKALAESAEDQRALAQAHNMLGILASSRADANEAIGHLEQSLDMAERAHDTNVRIAALNNLALALARRGDGKQAIARAEAALALCATQGDRHHEAALHNNIADLLHEARQPEAAMAHLKAAVTIYAEIGVEAGAVQPEIWKLTEW